MNSTLQTKKSFTLLEVMVSVAILAIGLALLLQGFTHLLNILRFSGANLKATLIADSKMEELDLALKEDPELPFYDLGQNFKFDNSQFNWDVKLIPDEEDESLNRIEATIFWKEGSRKGKIPLATYRKTEIKEKL